MIGSTIDDPVQHPQVRIGASRATDASMAVAELHAAIAMPDAALVVFFASPNYDRQALTAALNTQFADSPVIGCTTAGEIGPLGYRRGSLSGFSLGRAGFQAAIARYGDLESFEMSSAERPTRTLLAELSLSAIMPNAADTFGFLMIDGLSKREEIVSSALASALNNIPIFGGSAGDGLCWRNTYVFHQGKFHGNSALLTLIRTSRPFKVFQAQHFQEIGQKLVVTDANPIQRLVREINGELAAVEYAAAVGVEPEELGPEVFARYPVVVKINGKHYVRSIQKANPDGSLSFYCAIDIGVVLTLAEGGDIVTNLKEALAEVERDTGTPQLIIGCDCILRNLELDQQGVKNSMAELMNAHNIVGFSTYGEQLGAVHMNQTFTGVAIG